MDNKEFEKLKIMYSQYLDTGKTCREIGALNKRNEKVKNSLILQEYNKEYKRSHGLHYNHPKEFKEWSEKARALGNSYNDSKIEEFMIELQKLSQLYFKKQNK